MRRLTKLSPANGVFVTGAIEGLFQDEGYYGEAIDKLAKFENLQEHLQERHTAIPVELEALRQAKKEKTVTFKELLAEKMITDMLLTQLHRQGLE